MESIGRKPHLLGRPNRFSCNDGERKKYNNSVNKGAILITTAFIHQENLQTIRSQGIPQWWSGCNAVGGDDDDDDGRGNGSEKKKVECVELNVINLGKIGVRQYKQGIKRASFIPKLNDTICKYLPIYMKIIIGYTVRIAYNKPTLLFNIGRIN